MYHRRFVPFAIAIFAAALTTGSGAHAADVIQFDPDGSGGSEFGVLDVVSLDFSASNALAHDPEVISTSPTVVEYEQYFQGILTSVKLDDDSDVAISGSSFEITLMAEYTGQTEISGSLFSVGLASSPVLNSVSLFFDPTPDVDVLAGTGFGPDADTIEIFSGQVSEVGGFFGLTDFNKLFDDLGIDNYPGTTADEGIGGLNVAIEKLTQETDFFRDDLIVAEFEGTSATPFDKVNPSAAFADGVVIPNFGLDNKSSPLPEANQSFADFQFQTDGAASFIIPEPSTLALVGLGGLALLRRRRA